MSMTIPLWRVLELVDDPGTGAKIGLDAYPIFDENERYGINRLIIDHFWLRDIGQETISIFTFMLRRTMREIMPTYNQLYSSAGLLKGKELATYDLTTVRNGSTTGNEQQTSNSSTTATSAAKSRSTYFDTPQTALARNKDYAANATDAGSETDNTGGSTGTGSSTSTAASNDTSRTTGTQGSLADMLTRYRSTIINTDLMLLNDGELNACFMGVWDSPDPIEPPHYRRSLPSWR